MEEKEGWPAIGGKEKDRLIGLKSGHCKSEESCFGI